MIGNMLIVDDEPHIRKGLADVIRNNGLHWNVVGEASNGKDAMEFIRNTQPDLVVTDIRMPIVDGLQLAEYVHMHYPHTMVLLLTGYKDFEYAQRAVRLGVVEFLLKPCAEEDIVQVLREAYRKLVEAAIHRETHEMEKQSLEENTLRLMLLQLPYNRSAAADLEDKIRNMTIHGLMISRYDPPDKSYQAQDAPLLQFAVHNIVQEFVSSIDQSARLTSLTDRLFVVLANREHDEEINERLQEAANAVRNVLGLAVIHYIMGYGDDLSSCREKIAAEIRRTFDDGARDIRSLPPDMTAGIQSVIKRYQHEIIHAWLTGEAALQTVFDDMLASLAQSSVDAKLMALAAGAAMEAAIGQIAKKYHLTAEAYGFTGMSIHELLNASSTAEVKSQLSRLTAAVMDIYRQRKATEQNQLISKSIAYMRQNYSSNCTLQEVADFVHLSPAYFSQLFKKETGVGFLQYLTRIRMEKARLLLHNTSLAISEIAAIVGFADPNYFTTVFKQFHGVSPRQFRNT
jgi:two-component system response regulator YesN